MSETPRETPSEIPSEIPFVRRLGEAFQAAVADERAPRFAAVRGFRRAGLLAIAAVLVIGGTAAAVRILNRPEELASHSVGCYEDARFEGGVTILWAGDRDPVDVCADAFRSEGRPVPALVACAHNGAVAVIPGRDEDACTRGGMERLPAEYASARGKVAKLERDVMALERRVGCLPPPAFERRVRALLAESGWTGWTTWLRTDLSDGACGTVSSPGGTPERTISGAIDEEHHRIMVFTEPPRAAQDKALALDRLVDATGARCWGLPELRDRVRREAGRLGFTVAVEVDDAPGAVQTRADGTSERVTEGVPLGDARGDRWKAGCAILGAVGLHGDGRGVTVELIQKGAEGR